MVERNASTAWYVGGNAPAMANRLAKEGCEVLLGSRMSQKLRSELQEGIKGMQILSSSFKVFFIWSWA